MMVPLKNHTHCCRSEGRQQIMQSIRFSKELKDEFKAVFPDKAGYFSIKLGSSVNECIFDVYMDEDIEATEVFAKKYIQQEQHKNQDDTEIDRQRRDRLKRYNRAQHATKRIMGARSVNQSDPILKEDIKQLYRYKCQICSEQIKKVGWTEELNGQQEFEFLTADAHHIDPLEQNGLDAPSNIICVCPNCHRRLHTGELIIGFGLEGPVCNNQITGEQLTLTIDSGHSFGMRIEE
ncbi:MAG: putative HNH restriction endonuclease [Desulforhopalus sp.]|jgi:predicted HNH restriction endonuclease